eukprot:10218501-Ditylum_brightwellii.AAC.1
MNVILGYQHEIAKDVLVGSCFCCDLDQIQPLVSGQGGSEKIVPEEDKILSIKLCVGNALLVKKVAAVVVVG